MLLLEIDKKWKWLAMDEDGDWCLYINKPFITCSYWSMVGRKCCWLFSTPDYSGDWKDSIHMRNDKDQWIKVTPDLKVEKYRVKDPVSLMKQLVEDRYEVDSKGWWVKINELSFLPGMWEYCGEEVEKSSEGNFISSYGTRTFLPLWVEEY